MAEVTEFGILWIDELRAKYLSSISHTFIVHGNTKDLVVVNKGKDTITCDQLLDHALNFNPYVFRYDRAEGWSFHGPEHEEFFNVFVRRKKAQEQAMMQQQQSGRQQNVLAALQNFGGGGLDETPAQQYKDPIKAFGLIGEFLSVSNESENVSIIIDHAEALLASKGWGTNPVVDLLVTYLRKWAASAEISNSGNLLLVLCKDNYHVLHPALQDPEAKIESIQVPFPSKKEREQVADILLRDSTHIKIPPKERKQIINDLGNATAGLNNLMVEDCLLRCDLAGKIDPAYVKERKDMIISVKYDDVIEVSEPQWGFEVVGGLKKTREYMEKNLIDPLRSGNTRRCPMGILMTGPPGTGKSLLAEAVAKSCGVLFVNFRFAKVFSRYVGDSERNLDRILEAVSSFAPAIVFMDEIDQSGHNRGKENLDSGVSSRVFQRLLEFMSDTSNRGRIVFLAATNRPDLLDPAMKRAGRFDKKIPFLPPNRDQRKQVLEALYRKYNVTGVIPDEVLNKSDGYVGADLETIVLAAIEIADDEKTGSTKIKEEHLTEAITVIRPSITNEQIKFMSRLAIQECNDLRLLPTNYEEYLV